MPGVQTCALRSEEHTSELQSHDNLVCRLLLEKKKKTRGSWRGALAWPGGGVIGARSVAHAGRHGTSSSPHSPSASPLTARRGCFFFFNDRAPPEISPLPLHDALPIYLRRRRAADVPGHRHRDRHGQEVRGRPRSEEHTSELQSHDNLVCRLLLEK